MIGLQERVFSKPSRNLRGGLLTALAPAGILLGWVVTWTAIFSAIDFWSIKLYDVCNDVWFQNYRSVMRLGASWVSPPSFALAENAYFVWMNVYDRQYRMHEWDWYSGDPANPDGYYNFVWGNGNGGWYRYPMKWWYATWIGPTAIWFSGVLFILYKRGRRAPPRARPASSPVPSGDRTRG